MNKLWVLVLALGVVSADIGLTYNNYKVPQTSYGVPSYQFHSTSGHNLGYTDSSSIGYNYKQPVNKFLEHASTSDYSTSTASAHRYGLPGYHSTTFQHGSSGEVQSHPSIISTFGANTGNALIQTAPQYQTNTEHHSSVQKYQQYYVQQQPAEVYRHFYVHSAPEEPEQPKPRTPIVLPPPQKHYKIIFVKTPTESRTPHIVPVPPQNEEKTIVYVLVKKPEEQEVIVPKVQQKTPEKPEVYFIKYSNKQDSQAVIDNIVSDFNKGNVVTGSNSAHDTGYNVNIHQGHSAGPGHDSFGGSYISTPVQTPTPTTFVINGLSKGSEDYHTTAGQHSITQLPTSHVTTGGLSSGTLSTANLSNGGHLSHDGLSTGGLSTAVVNNGAVLAPIVSTSTATNLVLDHANTISTSQGVPHETYGPPKFRPN